MPRLPLVQRAVVCALLSLSASAVASSPATAAGWVPLGSVSPPAIDSVDPQTAIDVAGNITITWTDAGTGNILVSTRPAGGAFSSPQTLTTNGSAPKIGVGANGEATLVWRTATDVEYAVRAPGATSFGAIQTVANSDPSTVPALAVDTSGRAFIAWEDGTLGGGAFGYSVRQSGGSFQAAAAVPGTGAANEYNIAASSAGSAFLVWDDSLAVSGVSINANGSLGAPFNDLSGLDDADDPDVGLDQAGNPTIAWEEPTPGDVNVLRIASGVPSAVTPLATGVSPSNIKVTTTAAGSSHIIWSNNSGATDVAQARRITSSGTLGTFQSPLSPPGADASVRAAAGNPDGSVLAIWEAIGQSAMQAVRAPNAQPFGAFSQLGTVSEIGVDADVGIGDNGNGVASWTTKTTPNGVVAAGYDNTDPVLNNLTVPSSATQLKSEGGFSVQPSDVFVLAGPASWDFGDGTAATSGNQVSHTYAKPGTFTVTVSASDTAGNTTSSKKTIKVAAGPSAIGSITNKSLTLKRNGRISMSVRCAKSAVATCRGTVFLKSAKKVRGASLAARKRILTIGQQSYSIGQGKTATVSLKAKTKARRVIKKLRKLSARVSITGRDGFGKTTTKRKNLTLRASR